MGCCSVRASCTSRPRYLCQADYTNPHELPLDNDIPSLVNDIIKACRSIDPKARLSARQVLEMLPRCPITSTDNTRLHANVARHLESRRIYCDECGKLASLETDWYCHCSKCFWDDFDLCQQCYEEEGIRCLFESHHMSMRIVKDDRYYVLSSPESPAISRHVYFTQPSLLCAEALPLSCE